MYIWKFLSVYIACDIVCIYLWYDIVSFDNDNDNDDDSDNANGTYKLIFIMIINLIWYDMIWFDVHILYIYMY